MPGTTPPTSQLDWLISRTAMIVLFWSRATRDLLKSFGWGIAALPSIDVKRRNCHPRRPPIASLSWREMDSNFQYAGAVNLVVGALGGLCFAIGCGPGEALLVQRGISDGAGRSEPPASGRPTAPSDLWCARLGSTR